MKDLHRTQKKKLPDIRKGEYSEGLTDKLADPEWKPDFGPTKLHVKGGAIWLLGVEIF